MKIKKVILIALSHIALALSCVAQMNVPPTAGLYNPRPGYLSGYSVGTLMPGGRTVIPPLSTNTFLAYSTVVSNTNGVLYTNIVTTTNTFNTPQGINIAANTNLWMFNAIGFTNVQVEFALTGTASSANTLSIYQSQDQGNTFELSPIWQSVSIAPGAATFGTNFILYVPDGGVLAFVIANTGSTVASNAVLEATTTGQPIGQTKIIQ
jgi:hypothetical protein